MSSTPTLSVLTHHILQSALVRGTELVLGETRRGGAFEALLICRSPQVRFAG